MSQIQKWWFTANALRDPHNWVKPEAVISVSGGQWSADYQQLFGRAELHGAERSVIFWDMHVWQAGITSWEHVEGPYFELQPQQTFMDGYSTINFETPEPDGWLMMTIAGLFFVTWFVLYGRKR